MRNEYLPKGKISEQWDFQLEAMQAEINDYDREKPFHEPVRIFV